MTEGMAEFAAVTIAAMLGGFLGYIAWKLVDWIVKVLRKMLTKTKTPATMGDNFGEHR